MSTPLFVTLNYYAGGRLHQEQLHVSLPAGAVLSRLRLTVDGVGTLLDLPLSVVDVDEDESGDDL